MITTVIERRRMPDSDLAAQLQTAELTNQSLRNQNELLTTRIVALDALLLGYRYQIAQLTKLLTNTINERNRLLKGIHDGH